MKSDLFQNLPRIETERVLLRPFTLDDAADVFEYARDDAVTRYMSWPTHQSIADALDYLTQVLRRYGQNSPAPWGIVLRTSHKLIGGAGFVTIDEKDFRAEIGYVLGQRYWGQGYATEAARAIIEFAVNDLGINRVEAMCEVANGASARVMEKAGMSYEGILRQYSLAKGTFRDMKIYSILKSEWALVGEAKGQRK